jgi:hypothetical protein
MTEPQTSNDATKWGRTAQDDGWEITEGRLEGFFVLDEYDRDDFLDECDADDVPDEDATAVADLVWPDKS